MTPESAIHIISQAFMSAFWLAAPLLLLGFAVGIVVNLIQVATSLQDSAFSTFPRLAAFLTGVLLMMPWMLKKLTAYTIDVFSSISTYAR
ncbi:MAG: flagellar biosynthetic protein FliQ [Acidobacteriia bacterium]|nr:flagellar biosynthetic protein FliQ [Terriglobia bacterium]